MSDFVERLGAERAEIEGRIARLSDFLPSPRFLELAEEQKTLLREQLGVMRRYREILDRRLALLNDINSSAR